MKTGSFLAVSNIGPEPAERAHITFDPPFKGLRGAVSIPSLARCPDVTLRRGIIGSLDLYNWINEVRNGSANARRTVTIQLLAEDHTPVLTWKLLRAWPAKFSGPHLDAKGTDIAIEELVLSYECLEME